MTLRLRWAHLVVALVLVLGVATQSRAGTITLAWDASPFEDVAGYIIKYGSAPGVYPYALGVGNQTSATVSGLAGGQPYYFVVQAYSSSDVLGAPSHEVSATTGNAPPQLAGPGPQSSNEGDTIVLSVAGFASDPDGDPFSYAASGLPAGLSINSTTGIISGTLSYLSAGSHSVTLTVSDGFVEGALTAVHVFTWAVTNVNGPPVLAVILDQAGQENSPITLSVTASDPDGDLPTFAAAGLPAGLSINPVTGVISGTLAYTSGGMHPVTVTASDATWTARQTFTWTITNLDRPPVVSPVPNQTSGQYAPVVLPVIASDPDGDSVTFAASGLPPGLTIDPTTGRISGTLSPASVGVYPSVIVTALAGDLTATTTWTWTVTNKAAFPLKKSANGRYLVDQNNVPFLMTGDAPQAMIADLSLTDAAIYLADRKARGFNTLWVDLICKTVNYGCRLNGADADGVKPFVGGAVDFENILAPNEVYFAKADALINLAASYDMVVILLPMDTGGWMATLQNSSLANLRAYGRWVGNRYKNFDNIIWMHGDDFQNWRTESIDAKPREVALGIQEVDTRHLATIELDYKLSSSLDDPSWAPIIGLEASYTYAPTYAEILRAYNRPSYLPVFMVEANYEEEHLYLDEGTPETLRRQEYWTALSGAAGQLMGNKFIWQFLSGWQTHLNKPAAIQMGYLHSLLSPRAWFSLVPDQTHKIVTSGYGTFSTSLTVPIITNDYVAAAGTPDGSLVMAYLPTVRTITVDMSRLSGAVAARWFDPTVGTFVTISGSPFPNTGSVSLTPPGSHPDGSGDWVLVLESNPGIVLMNPGNLSNSAGAVISLPLVASSPYGDPLTFSATNLPLGLSIDSVMGLISGTLTHTVQTTYSVTVTGTGGTLTTNQSFTWTVKVNTAPPVLTNPGNQTGAGNTLVSLQLAATDPDATGLFYSATGLPPGLTLNSATGLISGTLSSTTAVYGVTATASDGVFSSSQSFTWTVQLSSAFVQMNYATPPSATTVTVPFTAAQTAGNLNVVVVGWGDTTRTVLSVTDTKGNPYAIAVGPTARAAVLTQTIYYAKNISAATANGNAVTVTFSGSATFPDIRIAEYRGINPLTPLDVTAAAQGSSTTSDSGAVTTTNANDVLVAANVTEQITTGPGTGYTQRAITSPNSQILMDRVVTATGNYSATAPIAPAGGWIMQLVAFRAAGGALNQPPTLTAVAAQSNTETEVVSLPLVGGDPEGTPVTYSATGLPAGLSVNAVTGVIAGTLTYASAGVHTVTATVSDQSLTASRSFTWTVTNVNRAPVLTSIADRTGMENVPATLSITATDPDTGDVLTYSATGLPPGLTINATTGVISGLPTFTSAGPSVVVVTVTDGQGAANSTASTAFLWTIANVNRAPTLTAIPNQTSVENAAVMLSVSATDPDGDDVLAYGATGLPQGLTINPATGAIAGTVSYTTSGLHQVTVTVTDGREAANSTATRTFTWTVTDVNRAPVLTAVANQASAENATITLLLAASDPDGNNLTYSATGLPEGLTIHPTTGVISGRLSYDSAGLHAVTVIASDSTLTASQSFTWNITNVNQPPSPSAAGNLSTLKGAAVSLSLASIDLDGDTLTYTAVGLPVGVVMDTETGLVTGAPSSTNTHTVTVTASDGSLTASKIIIWTVVSPDAPGVVTFRQANSSAVPNNATAVSVPYVAGQTAGDLNVVVIGWLDSTRTVQSVTDTSGNVYRLAVGPTVQEGTASQSIYYATNVSAATANANSVIVTFSGAATFPDIRIAEYARVAAVDPIDGTAAAAGTGTASDSGPMVTTHASDLLVAANLVETRTTAAGIGYTARVVTTPNGDILMDRLVGATGTYNATAPTSPSGTWIMQLVAFRLVDGSPELSPIAPQIGAENTTVSLTIAASDPDGDALTFTATGLPPALTIHPTTGAITGTLSFASAGMYTVTVMASDGALAATQSFTWVVGNTNRPPVVTALGNQTAAEPDSVTLSATATDPDGDTLTFSATGLPAGVTITPTGTISGTLSYTSAALSPYAVTVTATDPTGATGSTTFTWTVSNTNRVPVVTATGNQTHAENDSVSITVSATDPDGDSLTYSVTGLPAGVSIDTATGAITGTLSYASAGTHAVTVTVSDGTLTATQTFTWTVSNTNRAPVLTAIGNRSDAENTAITLALVASDPDSDSLTYSATGLPAGVSIDTATGAITGTLSYASAGTHAVTVTVSDGTLSATQSFTWTVSNTNRAPVLTAIANQTHAENDSVSVTVSATDPDGDTLTYSTTGLPPALSMDPVTGAITGTLSYASAGTHAVTVTVSDGTVSTTQSFTWTVSNTNRAPVLTAIANRSDAENTAITLALTATDADGDSLTYSATGLPAGVSNDTVTGAVTGTLSYASAGTHAVTVTVSDGTVSATQSFTWTVSNTNRAPVLTAIGNRSDAENTTITLALEASDPDGDSLTYSATGLPAGVSIDPVTGAITGTLSYASAGTHAVTVTVSDGTLTASQSFTWTVSNTNRAPILTAIGNRSDAENTAITLALTASDPDGDSLTYSATTLPPGVSMDPVTGAITGTLSYASAGTHPVTVTVSDGTLTTSQSFTWTVNNTNRAPILTAIANRSDAENTAITLALEASDPDSDSLAYSATGLPPALSIDPVTGAITGTLSYASAGAHAVTVTVSDGTLSATQSFTWTVSNTNRAAILTAIANRSDAENTAITLALTATDADGDSLTYSATGLPAGVSIDTATGAITGTLGYATAGTHTVTVTASDGTLSATQSFTWTVSNTNQAPVLTAIANRSDAENAAITLVVVASDADGDSLTYSATGLPPGVSMDPASGAIAGTLSYASAGTHAVTVSATDSGLAVGSQTFSWTVTNTNRAPVLTAIANQTHAENDSVSVTVSATDPDGDTLTYSTTGLPTALSIDTVTRAITGTLSYASAGAHAVTVTASDGTLSASQSFTWTVSNKNRAPVLTAIGNRSDAENTTITLALEASDPDGDSLTYSATGLPAGVAIDTATGAITGTLSYASAGTHTVTVMVSDDTLTASQSFTWTVSNTNRAPILTAIGNRSDAENTAITLALVASDPDADSLTYSATGLPPSVSMDPVTGAITGTLSYASAGAHAVTVTVSDGTLAASQSFTWTVSNTNRAPVLTAIANRSDAENTTITLALEASDPDSDSLAYSATGLPPALSIDTVTGAITGTLSYASAGAHAVTVTVSDGTLSASQSFTWTVSNTNQAPVLTAIANRSDAENAAITLVVVASDADGDSLTYSATGLPPGVSMDPASGAIAGTLSYASAGTHAVTVSATDSGLAVGSQTFSWTVTNTNRAPVLTAIANQTHAEHDSVSVTTTATDPDGDSLTYSATGVPAGVSMDSATGAIIGMLTYASAGTHAVTVTVSDGTLTATQSFTWTVSNTNQPPVLTAIGNRSDAENAAITLALVASDPDGDSLTYSASGLPPALSIDPVTGAITGTLSYASAGTHAVTVTVSDGTLTATQSFTWTVSNTNRAPVLTAIGNRSDAENAAITLALVASDPDGDSLTFSATGLPPALSIDTVTGAITGTLSYASAGTHSVTVTVSDGTLTASQSFTWTVSNTNRAPVLTAIANQTHAENDSVSVTVSATDPDGDTLTYSTTGLPTALSIDTVTGAITGTLSYASAGAHAVTVTASDGTLSASQSFTWTVSNKNRAPVLTAIANRSDAENTTITLALEASDPDGDSLTYSATGLPPALSIDPVTGALTGTLSYASAGTHPVTVTVSDGTLTMSQSFTWTVSNTNRAPVLTAIANQTHAENDSVSVTVTATDPDSDSLTYSATGLPPGVSIDTATGAIIGTLSYASAGTHTVTVTVSDGTLPTSQTFTWTVSNTNRAPVLTAIAPQTPAENDSVSVTATATDPDGDSLTYSAIGLPAGLSIDTATGAITGTLSYASAGTHTVTVTVSDGTLTASQSFTWTVSNTNQAPVLTAIANRSDAENAAITLVLTASDPDGDTVTYSATGVPPSVSIDPVTGALTGTLSYTSAGTHTVTVTASDGTLTTSQSFTWTVSNTNRAPMLTAIANQTHAENDSVSVTATGTDPDSDSLTYSATGLPAGVSMDTATGAITGTLSYASAGSHAVTVTVSDGTLPTSQTFTWTVTNTNRAPMLTAITNQTHAEHDSVSVTASATDPDSDSLTYSATGLPPSVSMDPVTGAITGTLSYASAGAHIVTVTVSDGTLSATQSFTWTVSNTNQPPVLTAIGNRSDAENTTITLALEASDPDSDSLTYSTTGLPAGVSIDTATGAITGTLSYASAGSHAVTVTASDGTLSATQSFTWTVSNTNRAPVLTAIANQTHAEHDSVSVTTAATDPDADSLTYSATGVPAGVSMDSATGAITGMLTFASAGTHAVTVTVSDGTLTATQAFTWTVSNTNQAPVLTAIGNRSDAENAAIALALTASDPDGDSLTYSATGLPPGVSMDPATGAITGTLSYTSAGTHPVTVTVSDGTLPTSQTFTWTVSNTNQAPVLTAIATQTPAENDSVSFTATATDPDGDSLTYSATGLPAGLSIDTATGAITGTLGYATAGTHTVTVTASDGTLTANQSATWTVTNTNQAPVLTAIGNRSDAENAAIALALTASDPDGDSLTYSAAGLPPGVSMDPATGAIAGTLSYTSAGTHPVTVTVSDGALTAHQAFTWTVSNTNQAPVLTAIANRSDAENTAITLALVASDPDSDSLTYSATGLPAGVSIDTATRAITGTLSYASAGTHTVTVTVSDGTPTSRSFTWTVTNTNRAPVLSAIANQTHAEHDSVSVIASATDPDGDSLTYSATGLPQGVSIDAVTGAITGTLSYTSAGTHPVTVTVSDGTLTAIQSFTWTVSNTNQAPVLTAIANRSDAENTAITLALVASDPDSDSLTYSATGLPAGVSIDTATGAITGTLSYTSAGTHAVTVTVSDGTLTTSQTFTWTVSNTNRAPVLTAIGNQTHAEHDSVSVTTTATDPDGDSLTYSGTGVPAGVSMDTATGAITGTLSYASAGTHVVTVTASDGTLTATQAFTWTVSNTNQPPVLTAIANQTHAEHDSVSVIASATDPDGDSLTYSATGLPPGVSIDAVTGAIAGTLSYASAGTHPVTVTVSDGTLPTSQTFTWTVSNTNQAPVLTAIASQTPAENDSLSVTATATDPDGDSLTYSATGLPAGLSIDTATGAITGTLGYATAGTHTVTVTASDGTLTANQSATWTVTNTNQAPVLMAIANRSDAENAAITLALVASDPDADSLTYSATTLPPGVSIDPVTGAIAGTLTYASAGTHAVTVTVSDGTLTATQTFTWTVSNTNQAPVLTAIANRSDAENAAITLALVASDPDSDSLTYSATGLPAGVSIDTATGAITGTLSYVSAGSHAVTVTVSDGTLPTSQTFTWTVTNTNRAPVLTAIANQTHAEHDSVSVTTAATDPDGDSLTYSATGVPAGVSMDSATGAITGTLTYASAGTHVVTVTVSDGTLTAAQSFTWTVSNTNQPPVLTAIANRSDAENAAIALALTASDPDGDSLTYSAAGLPPGVSMVPATGAIAGTLSYTSAGTHPVTVTVSDGTLTANQAFTWTVSNTNQAPVLTAIANRSDAENTAITLALVASDPDSDSLTYSATGLPAGVSIDTATGAITGTLGYASAGTHAVTVSATDSGLAVGSQTFIWTVTDVNRAPVLTAIADRTDAENTTVTLALVASDPDGTALMYSATGLPAGLTINPTDGVISGTLAYTSTGTYTVTATVSDAAEASTTTFTWTVTDVNRAPAMTAVGYLSTPIDTNASLQLAASDPDGDPVTYSVSGLPPGLSVDAGTGLISGAPSITGVYTVTAIATDAVLSHNQSFVWTVVSKPVGRVKFIQANSSAPQSPQPAVSVRYPVSQSTGHLNVVVVGWRDSTAQVQAVTDSTGNVYQLAVGPTMDASIGTQAIYYAANIAAATAGGNTVTVTFSAPPTLPDIRIAAYAGIDPVNALDATAVAQGTGSALDSGAGMTTFADDLLVGASLMAGPATTGPGAGYTARVVSSSGNILEDRIVNAVGGYSALAEGPAGSAWIMQMVAFRDPNPVPALTNPGSQVSAENTTVALALTASDPDDEPLAYGATGLPLGITINPATGVISGTLGFVSAGIYPVIATVSDGDTTISAPFTWVVTNVNRPPVLAAVANQTSVENAAVALPLVASDPDLDGPALVYTATGLPPSLSVNAATGLIAGSLTYASAGIYTVTATVSDGTLTATREFTWTVSNTNRAPVLTAVAPNPTSAENTAVTLTLLATDLDGDALTYSAAGLPPGLTIIAATGVISGTLNYTSAGTYTVTATASDGAASSSTTFTWTVNNVNRTPVLTAVGNQTSAENAAITLPLAASDPDGTALSYSATGLPASLSMNPTTGVIAGTLTYTSAGTYTVTATASDGAAASSTTFTWTVTNVNRAPVLTAVPNQTSPENTTVAIALVASDPDGTPLAYSATGLPASLSMNPTTGVIAGTLTYTSAGTYTVTATASDGAASSSTAFTWTVTNVNRAPVLTAVPNQTSPENATVALALVANDPDGTALTYSTTGLPASLSMNPTTGVIAGTLTYTSAGTYTVTATASDGAASSSATFTWTVTNVNRAPVLTAVANQTNAENATVTLPLVATDPDGDALTYSAAVLPAGLTIAPTTGVISGTLSYLSERSYVVTATVSDGTTSRNTTFTWTVTNMNRAPVLAAVPNQTSAEHATIALPLAASDPDGDLLTYSVTGLPASLSVSSTTGVIAGTLTYTSTGTYSVTATVSDGTMSSSQTFTWTVTNRATRADFDGDGRTDVAVYRPATGEWFIRRSSTATLLTTSWGMSGDVPVPGDYDGDGLSDVAVYRPATGAWYVRRSSTSTLLTVTWGMSGDIAVPGDYDGDGSTDIAVYRPATGTWYLLRSSTATQLTVAWGGASDVPVPGDYDGDGKTDIAVYRPATGEWSILQSSTSTLLVVTWGGAGDAPVPADYDGDGKTDIGVFRPATGMWYLNRSSTGGTTSSTYQWGTGGDVPVPGDYDGDGKTDIAVYRPSTGTWFVIKSSTNASMGDTQWGSPVDIPAFRAW